MAWSTILDDLSTGVAGIAPGQPSAKNMKPIAGAPGD
jgi:hypothetical protein